MTRQAPPSHKAMAALGWSRVDPKPWRSKLDARWSHPSGWSMAHCGHPTAHRPWAIHDPGGTFIGTAWDLRDGVEKVRMLSEGGRP